MSSKNVDTVDQVLVEKAKNGDKKAFDVLVLKYQRKIFRLLTRFIKDMHAVEEVVQETFIKAYKGLGKFRGDSPFYTWLYRIAINTAKNYLVLSNKNKNYANKYFDDEGNELDLIDYIPDYNTPETAILNKEILEKLNSTIEALPESLRLVINLREFDGLSYEEIAIKLNCPIGTVRSRIFRARDIISKEIRPLLDNQEYKIGGGKNER